jgi:hypothetical protein
VQGGEVVMQSPLSGMGLDGGSGMLLLLHLVMSL